jgi:hypothetical protein
MEGPSGLIAVVLAETAAGGAAFLWLTPLWGRVRRGFFVLTGSVVLGCELLALLASSSSDPDVARASVLLAALASALVGTSLAALILRLDLPGRLLGVASVPASLAALVALAWAVAPSPTAAAAQLLAGAVFMGAVTDGLLLGHWYLVDRRLSRDHIHRFATLLLAAVALEAVAVGVLGFGGPPPDVAGGFNPLLAIGGLSTWLALGMVACTGVIAVLIRASLKGTRPRAVQAATGFFYLAVITAFTAEMAAKIRFLA